MDTGSIDVAIGLKLRGLRNEQRLKQAELAEMSGLSESVIYRAEKGDRSLRMDQLDALCRTLGVELYDFVKAAMQLRDNNVDDGNLAGT